MKIMGIFYDTATDRRKNMSKKLNPDSLYTACRLTSARIRGIINRGVTHK